MKRILATTALVSLLAAPAFADDSAPKADQTPPAATAEAPSPEMDYSKSSAPTVGGEDILASDFINRPVYVGTIEGDAPVADASADWDNIGDINDVMMSKKGGIQAVLIDVGGFLGMGEHTVAVNLDDLSIVRDADDPDEVFIVSNLSRDELEAMPEFDEDAQDRTRLSEAEDAGAAPMTEETAKADKAAPAAGAATGAAAGADMKAADKADWVEADFSKLTVDDLEDATVYSSADEAIGEVEEFYLGKDGKIETAVVDVGGFLGIGEKPVALPFNELKVMQTKDGDRIRIHVDQTRESLESMAEYDEKS